MVQASSSWQSSIVELAQAGNSRAIAFWINRYLVPQGICAQVLADRSGQLLIRVVCHRVPDRDRLVQFICDRLGYLNSEVIRAIRITAQLVGDPKLLWEQSAAVEPVALHSATAATVSAPPPSVRSVQGPPAQAEQPQPQVQSQVQPQPQPRAGLATAQTSATAAPIDPAQPPGSRVLRKRRLKPKRPLWVRWSRTAVQQAIVLPETMRQLSTQSVDWLTEQTVPVRVLTVGGSAIAVFFMGCGFELLRQYSIDPGLGRSGAPFQASFLRNRSGKVQAALEPVSVIRPPIANPDDRSVTLLFSNSAALGRASEPSSERVGVTTDPSLAGGLAPYQQADLVMTSLEQPLSLQQPDSETSATASATTSAESNDRSSTAPTVTVQELLANGVDLVNLASAPSQPESAETAQIIDALQRSQIQPLGAGDSAQTARRPQVFDVKGQRIAYLGYADPTLTGALAVETGITPSLKQQMAEDIQALREQVDWIVVSFRWQRELRAYPEAWQVELSHLAIDQGADLVVGYHPQITQGAEIYQGRAIAYSLGSSVEESVEEDDQTPAERNTVALKLTIQDQQMQLEFLPVQISSTAVRFAEGEEATNILGYLDRASSLFEQPLRSSMTLDGRVRVFLPSAPDSNLPTEPFLSYPESPNAEDEQ